MLGVVESIWGEGRFQAIMDIMKKVVQWVMKGMIVLLSGSSILQIIITPVMDKANAAVIQKTSFRESGILWSRYQA